MLGQYGCVLHVNLRLASSSNNRALTIRDHLLPLVRERGTLENQRGSVRLIVLEMGLRKMQHWTPFNELSAGEASSQAIATRSSGSARGRIYSAGSTCRGAKVARRSVGGPWRFEEVTFLRDPGKMKRCSCANAMLRAEQLE